MALEIMAEVWAKAPEDVKGNRLLVLLRLANSANLEDRMTCVSVERLAKETRSSRRAVFDALGWLHDKGILQQVDESFIPPAYKLYPSTTRRITEPEGWDEGCPAPTYQGEGGAKSAPPPETKGGAKSAPNKDLYSYGIEREKSTSYSSESPPALRRSKSKSQLRREAARAEDDYDPAKFLFSDEDLGIEPPAQTSGRRAPGPDTGMGLAAYFVAAISRTGAWRGLDIANQQKLAGTLNRWKRQGTTPDFIRTMIDIYAADEGLRNPRAIPWTDFLAQRGVLQAKAEAKEKATYWDRRFAEDPEPEPEQPTERDPLWG